MSFVIDDRTVRRRSCRSCGEAFEHVTGYVNEGSTPVAVYFAACHGHPEHEAQIDVVLGTWGVEPPAEDHVTLSCRLRADGAMAVDASVATTSDATLLGRRLTRTEALAHARIGEFWAIVDVLAASDPVIERSVHGSD